MRYFRFLLFIFWTLSFQKSHSQYIIPQWATPWVDPFPPVPSSADLGIGINDFSVMPNGNIVSIAISYFYQQETNIELPSTSVCMHDAQGVLIWNRYFIGNIFATSIATNEFGQIFICGLMSGEVNFTPEESAEEFEYELDAPEAFVLQLDEGGNPQWIKKWVSVQTAPTWSEFIISQIEVNSANEIIIAGHYEGLSYFESDPSQIYQTNDFYRNTFVINLSNEGNINWSVSFEDLALANLDLHIDANNDIILTRFGSIVKLNNQGEVLWLNHFESSTGLFPQSLFCPIATDEEGNIYFCFESWSGGQVTYSSSNIALNDIDQNWSFNLLLKLNPQGDFLWALSFQAIGYNNVFHDNGIELYDLEILDGKLALSLIHAGTLDIDPTTATQIYQTGEYIDNTVLLFLDFGGNLFEAIELEGHWGFPSNAVEPTPDGGFIATLMAIEGTTNFNPYPGNPLNISLNEFTPVFVKYNFGGLQSVNSSRSELGSIYPNPSRGLFNLTNEIKSFRILDLQGKEIMKSSIATKDIDLTTFPNGIYFLDNSKDLPVRLIKSE